MLEIFRPSAFKLQKSLTALEQDWGNVKHPRLSACLGCAQSPRQSGNVGAEPGIGIHEQRIVLTACVKVDLDGIAALRGCRSIAIAGQTCRHVVFQDIGSGIRHEPTSTADRYMADSLCPLLLGA